jgi:murein DD-endopeptidase MepM/ murein hydrolase activator NlpD
MISPIVGYKNRKYPEGSITQFFAENQKLYASMNINGHNGIDIVAPWGTPIFAVEGGIVYDVKNTPTGYGMHVRILNTENEWTYGHLSAMNVEIGQTVVAGQCIGNMGNTGFVVSGPTPYWSYNPYAGTHLHLTCRKVGQTAAALVEANGYKFYVSNYANGYMGAVPFTIPDDTTNEPVTSYLTVISLLNQLIFKRKMK